MLSGFEAVAKGLVDMDLGSVFLWASPRPRDVLRETVHHILTVRRPSLAEEKRSGRQAHDHQGEGLVHSSGSITIFRIASSAPHVLGQATGY